jgi:anaerobic dimethyl sulfoxide reductase subunit A
MNAPGLMSGEWWGGSEAVTFFDSKLIILWGVDVFLNYPENAYYLLLAKERGIPLIVIEPRYTWTAHHADQWIPIRPGTDQPMMEAMAYVMFTEDLINQEFVDKWVEPYGLHRWKEYLLGNEDGVPKTPEWAEKICGVPAETIAELARLYGKQPSGVHAPGLGRRPYALRRKRGPYVRLSAGDRRQHRS